MAALETKNRKLAIKSSAPKLHTHQAKQKCLIIHSIKGNTLRTQAALMI